MSVQSPDWRIDGYATFRGLILDHQPHPFYFQIGWETVTSMAVDDVHALRLAAAIAHTRTCQSCKGSAKSRGLHSTIYVPAGRLDLDIPPKLTNLDWVTLYPVTDNVSLQSTASDPRIRIYSTDKVQLKLHVVLLFSPRDERVPSPAHKYRPSLRASRLAGGIFQLHPRNQRPSKLKTWPAMVDNFRLNALQSDSVFIDNTLCLTEIRDGLLVDKESRFCAIFASPGLNALRLFTFLEFYHSVWRQVSYTQHFSDLAISRNTRLDARSSHLTLIVDFTTMSWSPGFFESVDTMLSQIRTFLWRQVIHFEETNRSSYREPLSELPYCGGDEVLRHFLERIETYALKHPLFVVIHGMEGLFERPALASLWANLPHPVVSVIRERLNDYLFSPIVTHHQRPGSLVRKVLVTGLCPHLVVAGTALEAVDLIDISAHPSAGPLHGVLLRDAIQALEQIPLVSPLDRQTICRTWEHFSNKVRRVPRTDTVLSHDLDEYHDLKNLSELARAVLRTFERDPTSQRRLVSNSMRLFTDLMEHVSSDSDAAISQLLFPLIGDNFPAFDRRLRQEAATRVSELVQGTIGTPEGICAAHRLGSFSYDVLVSPRTDDSHWYEKAVELLYIHGYLKDVLNGGSPRHGAPYEIAGACAAACLIDLGHVWTKWRIATPSIANEKTTATTKFALSADILAKLIFELFRDRAPAQSEQEFQDVVLEGLRQLLVRHGVLPHLAQTEMWVRDVLETGRSSDGRLDFLAIEKSTDGGPDIIYAMEFKIRLLKCIIKDILKKLGKDANLRCTTTDDDELAQEYLKEDIRAVQDVPLQDGCYVDPNPPVGKAPEGTYTLLRVEDVLGSFEIGGGQRSPPMTITNLCGRTVPQLTRYVHAMVQGVEDELGYKPGFADVRITKISNSGSTVIIPIVIVSYGGELVCIRELAREEFEGRVAIIGIFPWSTDRRTGDASDPLKDKPRWMEFRSTEQVLEQKRGTRMNLCPFL